LVFFDIVIDFKHVRKNGTFLKKINVKKSYNCDKNKLL